MYGSKSTEESTTKQLKFGPQLYFGPGFEDRLEMELEEMLWSSNTNTKGASYDELQENEIQTRQQEAEFFEELAKPPKTDFSNSTVKPSMEVSTSDPSKISNKRQRT